MISKKLNEKKSVSKLQTQRDLPHLRATILMDYFNKNIYFKKITEILSIAERSNYFQCIRQDRALFIYYTFVYLYVIR